MNTNRRLLIGAVALAIAGPIAGLANFVFHAIAARALGPAAYGGLTSLLVLTVTVAVPAAAVQITLARSLLSGASSAQRMLRTAIRVAFGVGSVTALLSPVLASVLQLGSVLPIAALVGYLAATVVGIVPKAILVADERFVPLAGATLLGVALRLGIGALWLANGGGLVAAVLAGSIAEVAATAWLLWTTRSDRRSVAQVSASSWRSLLGPVLGLGALWCFLAVDTVVARVALEPETAGWYAAAAVLSRAVLFLPQTIATAAFARLADPLTRARALAWATAAALGVAVVSVAGLMIAGELLFRIVFGSGFSFDRQLLVVLGSSVAVVSVINVWIHARIAYGQPTGLRSIAMLLAATAGAVPAAAVSTYALGWWMLASAVFGLFVFRPRSAVAAPFPDPTVIPQAGNIEVSIVLPAYDVGKVLAQHLLAVERTLAHSTTSFEIIVVDDGSTDDTFEVAEAAGGPCTRVVRTPHRGKGAALRTGMAEARGDYIGFLDADGDIRAEVLGDLLSAAREPGTDGAVAVKRDMVTRGLPRRIGSIGYKILSRVVLAVDVHDTQTGAKVFHRTTVAAVLPWTEQRGFAWDAEFLAIARRLGFREFAEVTVDVGTSATSIRLSTVWAMFLSTIRIGARTAMIQRYPGSAEAHRHTNHRPDEPTPLGSHADGHTAEVPTSICGARHRILVLNWKCLRHPAAGGAEVFTHEVMRRWAALGHDVTLFTAAVDGLPESDVHDGYRVVRRGTRFSVYREARTYLWDNHRRFDIVVDEVNTRPFEAPLWSDVPVVAHIHQLARDVWFKEMPAPVAMAGRYVMEPTWLRAYRDTVVTTISDSSARSLRGAGLGRVINVGVGITLPDELPPPAKGLEPTVAFVGRMVSAKRPLDAIAGFAQARATLGGGRLRIVGDGPIAPLVAAAAARTPGVEYLGRVSEDDKFRILGESHALVVTSVREGWGLVVDEAAAMGAHAVGYRVPGLIDSIPAAGGTLVDPTPSALGATLAHLLPGLVERPQVPMRGGASDWDEVARRLLSVIDAVTTAPQLELTGAP